MGRFNESLTGAAFLFTLLGQHALRGSDEVPTVELPADWKKGDTYRRSEQRPRPYSASRTAPTSAEKPGNSADVAVCPRA